MPEHHVSPPSSLPSSYEDARAELVDVVRRLEAGGTSLQESLELWERGEALARVCEEWLDGARARVEAALGGANPRSEPRGVSPED